MTHYYARCRDCGGQDGEGRLTLDAPTERRLADRAAEAHVSLTAWHAARGRTSQAHTVEIVAETTEEERAMYDEPDAHDPSNRCEDCDSPNCMDECQTCTIGGCPDPCDLEVGVYYCRAHNPLRMEDPKPQGCAPCGHRGIVLTSPDPYDEEPAECEPCGGFGYIWVDGHSLGASVRVLAAAGSTLKRLRGSLEKETAARLARTA